MLRMLCFNLLATPCATRGDISRLGTKEQVAGAVELALVLLHGQCLW